MTQTNLLVIMLMFMFQVDRFIIFARRDLFYGMFIAGSL